MIFYLNFRNEDTYVNNNQLKVADNVAVIPANTRLQIAISTSADKKVFKSFKFQPIIQNNSNIFQSSVEISISTNNSTIIKAVIIFADGIFPNGETLIVHPPAKPLSSYGYGAAARTSGTSKIVVPLKLPKDEAYDIHIKVCFIADRYLI
jgi:Bardet-Biedl syndrome 2 protein